VMLMTVALRPLPLPHQSRGLLWMLRPAGPAEWVDLTPHSRISLMSAHGT